MSENQHNFVKVLVLYSIFECFLIKLFNFNKTQNVKFPFVTVNFNGSIETFRCYEGKYCCKTHTQNRNTHTMRTTLREKLCTKCTTACVMKDCETQTYSHFIFNCAPLHTISSIDTSYISYIYIGNTDINYAVWENGKYREEFIKIKTITHFIPRPIRLFFVVVVATFCYSLNTLY